MKTGIFLENVPQDVQDTKRAPAWVPATFSEYVFPAEFPALRLAQEKQRFRKNYHVSKKTLFKSLVKDPIVFRWVL